MLSSAKSIGALLLLLAAASILSSCGSSSSLPVDPKTINLASSTQGRSRSATPPHRMSKYEYPFDGRGNYVGPWAAEGEKRAGRSPVKSTPRTYSSSSTRKKSSSSWKAPAATYHTVRPGDTLSAISRRYGTSVSALKSRNGLRSDLIRIGQRLRIK